MITNADITVFNKWYNEDTRLDEWHSTQISGVSWYGGQAVTVGEKGLVSANTYAVRIPISSAPADKSFAQPENYASVAQGALGQLWTLQNGDYIVRGLVDTSITQPDESTGEHFVVTGWSDNRRGGLPHWKVTGK